MTDITLAASIAMPFIALHILICLGIAIAFSTQIVDGLRKLLQRNTRKELYAAALQDVLEPEECVLPDLSLEDSPRTLWGNYKYKVKYID